MKRGTVRGLRGKGDKSRVVGLDEGALAIIQRWLDKRSALGIDARRRLFSTLKRKLLRSACVRALLPRLDRRARIANRVHAHGLRHLEGHSLDPRLLVLG